MRTTHDQRGFSKTISFVVAAVIVVAALSVATLELPAKVTSNGFKPTSLLEETEFGYYLRNREAAAPVGLAAYGVTNQSGALSSYTVNSLEVEGVATISSLAGAPSWNYSLYPSWSWAACDKCASLQMNVNIVVDTAHSQQIFWVQNSVPFEDTASRVVTSLRGIIWNETTATSNLTASAVGDGDFSSLNNQTVYGFGSLYPIPATSYSLPLRVVLTTSVKMYAGGVRIVMGDSPFGNGTFAARNDTFGWADVPIGDVSSAQIVVTPTPYPWVYTGGFSPTFDSELVWTGYCCGQNAMYAEMNSSLSLLYLSPKGVFVTYPSYYSFGEVVETASNLEVVPTSAGGYVRLGTNDNEFLGG